jgi:hypothetical protein
VDNLSVRGSPLTGLGPFEGWAYCRAMLCGVAPGCAVDVGSLETYGEEYDVPGVALCGGRDALCS